MMYIKHKTRGQKERKWRKEISLPQNEQPKEAKVELSSSFGS